MMSGMENLPILEKLLLFKEQHPAIPLHFHLGDFPTLKKRLQQKRLTLPCSWSWSRWRMPPPCCVLK